MTTISIPPMGACDQNGASITVYGITTDGTVPQFIAMRQNEDGDFVLVTLPAIRGVETEAEAAANE